ncbi:MAG: thioesterase family protein [Thermoanaerobaculia bacterium]
MNLLFRFLLTLVASTLKPRLDVLGLSTVRFRVWPNDLDVNFHLNNGRYLSIMDLGRFDMIIRMGIAKLMIRRRWYPLVGSASMRFVRSLDPFVRYELQTRLAAWDDKWWYIEQRFVVGERLMAYGMIKGLFRGPGGNVRPAEVLTAAGLSPVSPEIPEWFTRSLEMEEVQPLGETKRRMKN